MATSEAEIRAAFAVRLVPCAYISLEHGLEDNPEHPSVEALSPEHPSWRLWSHIK